MRVSANQLYRLREQTAWKKLTSWHVLWTELRVFVVNLTEQLQVLGGGMSGKCGEILIKVGLIIVAMLMSHLAPPSRLSGVKTKEHVPKTVDAGQLFGCPTRQLLELGNQVFLADTHLVTE